MVCLLAGKPDQAQDQPTPSPQTNIGLPGNESDSGHKTSLPLPLRLMLVCQEMKVILGTRLASTLPPSTPQLLLLLQTNQTTAETTTVYYTPHVGTQEVHTYLSSVLWLLVDLLCLVHNQIHELIKALGRGGRKTFAVKT